MPDTTQYVAQYDDLTDHSTSLTGSDSSIAPGSESDVDYTDRNGDLAGFVVPDSFSYRPHKRRRISRYRTRRASDLVATASASELSLTDSPSPCQLKQGSQQGLLVPYGDSLASKIDYVLLTLREAIDILEAARVVVDRSTEEEP
ncbi:hypothetical protein FSARC_14557 [Fusarium sarcochroum]|uniref:Uncharacterized protein n=1 Tax=Fusarium sarcochroum TaxID=1208366 RepID=A0A8H4SSX0_9HYPO|nr:hypothetical protein FSARC_14557 [Fusarium sarcochroum]